MAIYRGLSQLQNGGSFHSYVKLPEGNSNIAGWCPSSLAKLVNISPISLWFLLVIYL